MKKNCRVVIIGGGWAGCAAAIVAHQLGASVNLLERTDMLLGTGLVGGIFRNNGRYTATEELTLLGNPIFEILDQNSLHHKIEFPGHKHASLYNVWTMEAIIREYLEKLGIDIVLSCRITDLLIEGRAIKAVYSKEKDQEYHGDIFIDATGTTAVPRNCAKYGNGCAMCMMRCHSFGSRVDLLSKAGVRQWNGQKPNGKFGAMSGSCKLGKESINPDIVAELEEKGVALVKVPEELREDISILTQKACQQYALKEFLDNLVLLDTGPVKLMTPFFPLSELRKIPGMEKARFEDPLAGGIGNSMRYFGFADCTETLKTQGNVDNLFCAGEKAGAMVGHTEAIVTGSLAAYNAVSSYLGKPLLQLPDSLALGDFINSTVKKMKYPEGRMYKYTFSGSVYFDQMKEKGLYSINRDEIKQRVKETQLTGIFTKKL
jgi:hypothetical protein